MVGLDWLIPVVPFVYKQYSIPGLAAHALPCFLCFAYSNTGIALSIIFLKIFLGQLPVKRKGFGIPVKGFTDAPPQTSSYLRAVSLSYYENLPLLFSLLEFNSSSGIPYIQRRDFLVHKTAYWLGLAFRLFPPM